MTEATGVVSHRPRWRSYLLLARISNLPTVWSNALAGAATAATAGLASPDAAAVVPVAIAVSLFYMSGMFLNDAFDAAVDAGQRPERPIPSGDVPRAEAFTIGAVLLVAGEALLSPARTALLLGAVLAAAIVYYDSHHKGVGWAPLVMGFCRALVYAIAASAAGAMSAATVAGAVAMLAYVSGLTVVARRAGQQARWLVPTLIAGISLLDAAVIAIVAGGWTVAAAAAGFPLTLLLQRFVPGD